MLNFAIISGYRYFNGYRRNVIYLGNVTEDGWIYFEDDLKWRYAPSVEVVQVFYYDKQIWVNTNNMEIDNVISFNAVRANNTSYGGGSMAPNSDVETAVRWAIDKCTSGEVTYSWGSRNLKNPSGDSFDCSSFVITAFYYAGFDADCYDTTTMRAAFVDLGFTWIPGNYFPAEECLRGDILLNEYAGELGHTQIYVGNNQDANCGGGNARLVEHTPNNYGNNGGWHGILRYEH